MSAALEAVLQLKGQMERAVIGQSHVIERLLVALLCNGNLLLEGLPGTAKTRSIKSLAQALDAGLGRIQFTPDLLPSDVTGTEVYHVDSDLQQSTGQQGAASLTFQPGPIFNNLVLADEINRAPAKVQSALLEAMEERQVTVAGKTYPLPELFMVLATQNPIEQEGTYPLPEAQMDRFLMKVSIDYPDDDAELNIIRLVRDEENQTFEKLVQIPQQAVFDAREQVRQLAISEPMERYIVALVMATRDPSRYSEELAQWIAVGASPRASIALDRSARAYAWLQGRDFVSPEDVRAVAEDILGHRIIVSYTAQAEGMTSRKVVREIMRQVAVA